MAKLISLKEAAGLAKVSPETIARWGKRYGIARQMHPNAPWRVDPVALAFVAVGDAEGLKEYQAKAPGTEAP